jgi:hypothetical protein
LIRRTSARNSGAFAISLQRSIDGEADRLRLAPIERDPQYVSACA